MKWLHDIKESLVHLAFPHHCSGCGTDKISDSSMLCMRCMNKLPSTEFHMHASNPVEKIFWGRVPITHATAQFYFTKGSMIQHLMHQLKYKGNQEIGVFLGRIMGQQLRQSNRFNDIDLIIPLPLFKAKLKRRGYNQSATLAMGMGEVMKIPVNENVVERIHDTETQTKKTREERWMNIEGKFRVTIPATISEKHILLVDDVVTTGATLEACAQELLLSQNCHVSIATLCVASRW